MRERIEESVRKTEAVRSKSDYPLVGVGLNVWFGNDWTILSNMWRTD